MSGDDKEMEGEGEEKQGQWVTSGCACGSGGKGRRWRAAREKAAVGRPADRPVPPRTHAHVGDRPREFGRAVKANA